MLPPMNVREIPKRAWYAFLLLTGFVLGWFGIQAFAHGKLAAGSAAASHQPIARAMCENASNDDIFFLSCGGIY